MTEVEFVTAELAALGFDSDGESPDGRVRFKLGGVATLAMSENRHPYDTQFPHLQAAETWRPLLEAEREAQRDTTALHVAPNELILDESIAVGRDVEHFLAWSDTRVYFPVRWKGNPFVSSVPRSPQAGGEFPIDLT